MSCLKLIKGEKFEPESFAFPMHIKSIMRLGNVNGSELLPDNHAVNIRLLFNFLLLGLLNLIIICFFLFHVYSNRREILIDRAEEHMVSVRSFTKTKIRLYLDNLKSNAIRSSEEYVEARPLTAIPDSVSAVYLINGKSVQQISGSPYPYSREMLLVQNLEFSPFKTNKYLLKVETSGKTFIWLFNHHGMDKLLSQRDGLGESGEVYLVDSNFRTQSASRHVRSLDSIEVRNQSVLLGLYGKTGSHVVNDYRNVEVVSAYSSIHYDQIRYVLLSEIDLSEVLRPIDRVLVDISIFSFTLLIINVAFAFYQARKIAVRMSNLKNEVNSLNMIREKEANESAIQVLRAQEDEREKFSFNLHDSVGQYLTVLKWGLAELKMRSSKDHQEKVELLLKTCDDIIHEIRTISHDLMPTLIKDFGCCLAIKDYLEKQKLIIPIKINFSYPSELEHFKFRKEFDINLYRMVQEFFQNSLKHSNASIIDIKLQITDNKFILSYQDNGKGMTPTARPPTSLNYRAKLFGGKMVRIKQEKGLGFSVSFDMKDIGHEKN